MHQGPNYKPFLDGMLEACPEINFQTQFSVQNKTYNLYSNSEENKYVRCCFQASSFPHSQPYHLSIFMSFHPKTLFTNPPPSSCKHNSSPTTRNPNAKHTSTTLKGTKCCLILKQLSSTLHLLLNLRRRGLDMSNSCSKWSIHLKGVASILCRCNDVKFLLMLTICSGCTLCLTRIYKINVQGKCLN